MAVKTPSTQIVLDLLTQRAREARKATVTYAHRQLAVDAQLSERQAYRALRDLEAAGLIRRRLEGTIHSAEHRVVTLLTEEAQAVETAAAAGGAK